MGGLTTLFNQGGAQTRSIVGSGGIVFSGAAAIARTRVIAGSGGLAFGGTGAIAHVRAIAASGGLLFGGAAGFAGSHQHAIVGSGGIVFGGAAAIEHFSAAAGAVVGGPWRRLAGEYTQPRRRGPAFIPLPPLELPAPWTAKVIRLPDVRVTVEGDSPYRERILGELVAPLEPKRRPKAISDDEAIALLLAA
jgi:hypothetical protein